VLPADLEKLEAVYARWARGDWSAGPDVFAEDIVFMTFDADGDDIVCHGIEAIAAWLRPFLQQWTSLRKEIVEIETAAERALVVCRQFATGRASGVPLEMPAYDVWTFRGGRATELHITRHEDVARAKFNAR
jgi:ketosteroid isomerase-like protein